MCWLHYTNITKQNTIQTRTFLLRDRKNVSISILLQKVFLRWKISRIINRIDGGSWNKNNPGGKNWKINQRREEGGGTSIKHSKVNRSVAATISHNECKDVLSNNKCIRHSMNRIKSKDHQIGTYEISKVSLFWWQNIYSKKWIWWISSWLSEFNRRKQLSYNYF